MNGMDWMDLMDGRGSLYELHIHSASKRVWSILVLVA